MNCVKLKVIEVFLYYDFQVIAYHDELLNLYDKLDKDKERQKSKGLIFF